MTPRPRKAGGPSSGFAVAYRRVSTDEQKESGLGLDAQAVAIAQAAARLRLTVRDTFTDAGLSGALSIDRRPGLRAALAALQRGDTLLVAKRDRIARDLVTGAAVEGAARRKGARIVSAAGEGTDRDDPDAVLQRMIVDAFGVYERLIIGSRTSAALAAKAARGERYSRHAPLGFAITPDGRLEPHEPERAQLRLIEECRDAGYSWDGIARELDRLGYVTRSGRPWTMWNVRSAYATAVRSHLITAEAPATTRAR